MLGEVSSSTRTLVLAKKASFCGGAAAAALPVEGDCRTVGLGRTVDIRMEAELFSFSLLADEDTRQKERSLLRAQEGDQRTCVRDSGYESRLRLLHDVVC